MNQNNVRCLLCFLAAAGAFLLAALWTLKPGAIGLLWEGKRITKPEFPFEHPAAEEVRRIIGALPIYTEADYRRLPRRDRYVWDVWLFEDEVMNGGLDQYLWNSSGGHSQETLEALHAIKATKAYDLLRHACNLFPDGRPSPVFEIRREQLRKVTGRNHHLDDLVPSGEIEVDLYQHLLDYWRNADPQAP